MPLLILIIQTLLFTAGCKQSTEPKLEAELKLELEDTSCTEAWIKLSATNLQSPATINLLKDGSVAQTISLWRDADTVLYVDSLLPNQTYKFKTIVQSSNQQINTSSNEITVTTMDTTSHEFSWQSWEFGTTGSSTLYDVAIIDENDIWAVGEINIADTSINGYTTYNAVHWDGTKWELKRIYHYSSCNPVDYPAFRSIYAFSDTNIVLASRGSIGWFNGKTNKSDCSIRPLLTGAINKLWGSSSGDLYAVGNNGNIAHWDGRKWTKIESGTTLPIRDIWGDFNDKTNSYEIIAIAAEIDINKGSKLLSIKGYNVIEESNSGLSWDIGGIWFKSGKKYYIAGAGIHYKHSLSDSVWQRYARGIVTNYTGDGIKGENINDVFTAGDHMEIVHFNGFSWHNYIDEISSDFGVLDGISIKWNIVAMVGFNGTRAVVVVGRRN
ncbi:MAG: glucosyl transferase [Ignavibacterium album]|nr:glucosyl transferase [Ignavibacterium album]